MHLLGNIIFFVFGGFIIALGCVLGGVLLCLTIIGIPIAAQHIKLLPLALFPFGREMRTAREY
jgi:uncharacterized membrane protein YccF (DUF307 family)